MTSEQIQGARRKLGLTLFQLATLMGYTGEKRAHTWWNIETGRRPLHDLQRRLLQAYIDGYRPKDWPPNHR